MKIKSKLFRWVFSRFFGVVSLAALENASCSSCNIADYGYRRIEYFEKQKSPSNFCFGGSRGIIC